jgi:UDPglucose 6-dehydrogenase
LGLLKKFLSSRESEQEFYEVFMKVTVVGIGYVGLSNAVLLAQHNEVVCLDLSLERVRSLNDGIPPIRDQDISLYLTQKKLNLRATVDKAEAYHHADYVIVATPTDYDAKQASFDTSSVDEVLEDVMSFNPDAIIIIKSTVPVGYTSTACKKYKTRNIVFSPEFLREGKALIDNLYPSRIVVGDKSVLGRRIASLFKAGAIKMDTDLLFTGSSEAEAIKLFSNTYLAMRVAYFNELDSYCAIGGLSTKDVINGVCLDPRIGSHYNNPSFGYGGYCLPKDTKQLLANYEDIPQNLIRAVVEANETRKDFVVQEIKKRNPRVVGIYRLIMKTDSDNVRSSSITGILDRLREQNIQTIVYEPLINADEISGAKRIQDPADFKSQSDVIVTNRMVAELEDVQGKVYSRDIFSRD